MIYPEASMGERVAHLVTGKMIDFIELEDGYAIAKTRAPRNSAGHPLAQCGWRSEHGVTVVGVKRLRGGFAPGLPDTLIREGDLLIVAGVTEQVDAFASKVSVQTHFRWLRSKPCLSGRLERRAQQHQP